MKFHHHRVHDEPEINLIPLIDVLLVVLIFMAVTTTFVKPSRLAVSLPSAQGQASKDDAQDITVSVTADGQYAVGSKLVPGKELGLLFEALKEQANGNPNPVLIVRADAGASHQSVVHVLEAARRLGWGKVGFAAQARDSKK